MKLKNKKTGEVLAVESISLVMPTLVADKKTIQLTGTDTETGYREIYRYKTVAELNEKWEDYEEPKEYWYIDYGGRIKAINDANDEEDMARKEIGNYFETKEEAEKAVKKLKAWKRLKDDGLKIRGYELNGGTDRNGCFTGDICLTLDMSKPVYEDILQLLFGGEE